MSDPMSINKPCKAGDPKKKMTFMLLRLGYAAGFRKVAAETSWGLVGGSKFLGCHPPSHCSVTAVEKSCPPEA